MLRTDLYYPKRVKPAKMLPGCSARDKTGDFPCCAALLSVEESRVNRLTY
jgi:hypothetical protein